MPPHHDDDLADLMRAANGGDADAYRRVLHALAGHIRAQVRRGLTRAGRGVEDVEDVVQETLLAVHLKRHTWDERLALMPWVRAIAAHKLVDHLRRGGARVTVDIETVLDDLPAEPAIDSTSRIDRDRMIASLPERSRRIVEAIAVEGRSAREVADELSMTEGAVRVALHRALKQLADRMRRDAP